MSDLLSIKTRGKQIITGILVDEYNSLYTAKEDRIKKGKDEMKIIILVDDIELGIYSTKRIKMLNLKSQNLDFTYNFTKEILEYLISVQSLVVFAEQHRQLAIIKLEQVLVKCTTNRISREMVVGVTTKDANVKIYVPMFFEVMEEVCEYLAWIKTHTEDTARPQRSIEEFYYGNVPKQEAIIFKVLELNGRKVSVHVLFTETLIYNIKLENVTNDPELTNQTPIVCYKVISRV